MLIRFISSISKWDESKVINRPDAFICGDAISDLRTTDNNLSVWKADSEEDIEDAIVALALNRDAVEKIIYILIREEDLAKLEIEISDKKAGKAPGLRDSILNKHRDLIELDFWRIGFLAEYMLRLAKDEKHRKLYSKADVKMLLNKYKERIDIDNMSEKLKEKLKW